MERFGRYGFGTIGLPMALVLLASVLPGCASVDEAGVEAFRRGDLQEAMELFREAADREERNRALHLNDLGTAAMLAGETEEAKAAFLHAGRIMGTFETGTGEELKTVLLAESEKTYRGDPYEKGMNSFYAGLLFYREGEYDTALAGFKSAALADSGTFPEVEGVDDPMAGQRYECDNALVLMMEGKCHRKLGEEGSAARSFELAETALQARGLPHRQFDAVRRGDPNTTVFVEIGLAPRKVPDGRHGSAAVFVPSEYPERTAEVLVDGRSIGTAELIEDVYFQAVTQGGREMDAILAGKAVFKDVAVMGGYIALAEGSRHHNQGMAIAGAASMALGLLVSAEADVRHWRTLPDRVLVVVSDVPPGLHDVTIRFRDASGNPIPELRQEWKGLRFEADRENVLLFRAAYGPPPPAVDAP
jgi:tetratricopeptide (TPR) repeat protein